MGCGSACRQTEGYDKATFFDDEPPLPRPPGPTVIDIGADPERMRNYLAGRLTDEEDRAFSERLVRDPDLVRELELTARLQEGLRVLAERGQIDAVREPRPRYPLGWFGGLIAAGLAVAVLTVALHRDGHVPPVLVADRTHVSEAAASDTAIAALYSFVTVREPAATPVLELPRRGTIEFRVLPPARAPGAQYRVTLDRIDGARGRARIGSVSDLEEADGGYLYCYADAARLVSGDYELRVEPEGSGASEVGSFPFRLKPLVAP